MKKVCGNCKLEKDVASFWNRAESDTLRSKCKKCMNKAVMKYKKGKHTPSRIKANARRARRYYANNPLKVKARYATKVAIKRGELILKTECEMKDVVCGGRLEVHHKDYNAPLEVIVLCQKHHHQITYP